MNTQKNSDVTTRVLTPAELVQVDGGAKHLLPIEPIDGIDPIIITPIVGPVIIALDLSLL
jgi:hypothetical protein